MLCTVVAQKFLSGARQIAPLKTLDEHLREPVEFSKFSALPGLFIANLNKASLELRDQIVATGRERSVILAVSPFS